MLSSVNALLWNGVSDLHLLPKREAFWNFVILLLGAVKIVF